MVSPGTEEKSKERWDANSTSRHTKPSHTTVYDVGYNCLACCNFNILRMKNRPNHRALHNIYCYPCGEVREHTVVSVIEKRV